MLCEFHLHFFFKERELRLGTPLLSAWRTLNTSQWATSAQSEFLLRLVAVFSGGQLLLFPEAQPGSPVPWHYGRRTEHGGESGHQRGTGNP